MIRFMMTMMMFALVLGGCREPGEPKPPRFDEVSKPSPANMGSFNLNKRHGLGGWDDAPKTSEQDLVRGLSEAGNAP